MDGYRDIWNIYDNFKKDEKNILDIVIENGFKCVNCNHIEYDTDHVCTNCGLMNNNDKIYDNNINYDTNTEMTVLNYPKKKYNYDKNNHLCKMKTWYENTSEEKNEYKLLLYTKKICNSLEINSYIDYICDLVNKVLKCIKLNDGTKRSRVKDGIIVVCIYYTYKKHNLQNYTFTLQNIAKKLDLNIKYISKAEITILELINKKKISMDRNILLNIDTSLNILPDIKLQFRLYFDHSKSKACFGLVRSEIDVLFKELESLLKYYENNELFNNHTPFSITVGCLYYLLKQKYDSDIILLSNVYNISHITILKIYKNLVQHININ